MSYELHFMSYELHFMSYELHFMSYKLHFMSYELHFMSYIPGSHFRPKVLTAGCKIRITDGGFMMRLQMGGGGGFAVCGLQDGGCRMRLQDAGCRMQIQVAYKYGSFVYLGKVKKISNFGCSCPNSDLPFLSRGFDRG